MKISVLISSIDALPGLMPYQWALLKTYADQDPVLRKRVSWLRPLHTTVEKALIDENPPLPGKVDVFGISCYSWNFELQLILARQAKALNPACLVVAGGPQIPENDSRFLERYPEIDVVVKKDGELTFTKVLKSLVKGTKLAVIPGLIVRDGGAVKDTGTPETLQRFDVSPWLHNRAILEKIAKKIKSSGIPLKANYETNRGCPFTCTYCNWGSSTMSKIRKFDPANVMKELEWFQSVGLDELHIIDANFGMLPFDDEISEKLVSLRSPGFLPIVTFYTAKNNVDRALTIARRLYHAGFLQYMNIGIQTTSTEALAAIGRKQIIPARATALITELKRSGVPIAACLILGCPGETRESWRKTVTDVFSLGVSEIMLSRFQILPNTPADEERYRRIWKIRTFRFSAPEFTTQKKVLQAEYICSTSSFNEDDYAEMEVYYLVVRNLLFFDFVRNAMHWLTSKGFPPKEFFDALYDEFISVSFAEDVKALKTFVRSFTSEDECVLDAGRVNDRNFAVFISERIKTRSAFADEFADFVEKRFKGAAWPAGWRHEFKKPNSGNRSHFRVREAGA